MASRVVWSAVLDGRLRELRWVVSTWDQIAVAMNLGRNSVIERDRRIGARRQPAERVAVEPPVRRVWSSFARLAIE